ncbi:nitroreductase family protein [Oceanospirillum beijerinckii]|uniref:nitroreductase family protein n=1 Tax=Oceanospirillum beijerinckii TaxID=64976 RepID=UPI0003F629DA|nr:nitroreductase family protein [Oceanospirillum beijerinckii]
MNVTIRQLLERHSIRQFTGEAVKHEDFEQILRAGQQAPTSINGQQISLVVSHNRETIAKIAEIAGGQPQVATADLFITVVIDFNRTALACEMAEKQQVIEQSAEGIIAGAIDAGIILNALQTAANALGYGSTAIGGIRNNPQAMIELLNLPKKTFPVNGLTLGVPDKNKRPEIKPRVPLASFAMCERYDSDVVRQGVCEYNKTLRQWWDQQDMTQQPSYCESVASFYDHIYFSDIANSFEQQGFRFSDTLPTA